MSQRYRVRLGDSPAGIAILCGVSHARWRELAAANPHKKLYEARQKTIIDGFSISATPERMYLVVGEYLTLPEGWECPPHRLTW